MQLTDYEKKVLKRLEELIYNGQLSNNFMVQNMNLLKEYLNPVSIQTYADEEEISYNGAKKRAVQKIELDGKLFIINNA